MQKKFILILTIGKTINVIPIWKKIGPISGIDKFTITLSKNTIQNENIKIIVKDNHSSFLLLVIFSKIILLEKYFNKRRKTDVIPIFTPLIISSVKPRENNNVLEGFILNLVINKYNIIETIFGVIVSNKAKKLSDFSRFIKQNKITKNNKLLDNS